MTFNKTNPKDTLGFGIWEQITRRFLYSSSSSSGTFGGASSVSLTTNELPKHSHTFTGKEMTKKNC